MLGDLLPEEPAVRRNTQTGLPQLVGIYGLADRVLPGQEGAGSTEVEVV